MKTYQTLNIAKNFFNQDVDKSLEELTTFTFVLNYLANSLYDGKVKIKPWQRYMEILLFKMCQHTGSLVDTIKGLDRPTHKKDGKFRYPDLCSSYVLARAIMETYLMTYYLNFDSKDADQCEFRRLLYEYSGLSRRQQFFTDTLIGIAKLEQEKVETKGLKDKLNSNKYFLSLNAKRQNKLLLGNEAKEMSFEDILSARGVKSKQVHTLWKLYSNYAHSEYLCAIQMGLYLKNNTETRSAVITVLTEAIMILTLQIHDLLENFTATNIAYNTLDQLTHSNVEVRIQIVKNHFFKTTH